MEVAESLTKWEEADLESEWVPGRERVSVEVSAEPRSPTYGTP